MKLSAFQKVVYCLSFFAIVLSALTSTAMLPFQNLRSVLSYVFLIADFAIIILIKVFLLQLKNASPGIGFTIFFGKTIYLSIKTIYTQLQKK